MAILKNEYEISIWNEYLDSTGKKVESKGAIIGAHDMTYLGRAINPNLRREMKGTNTLTFDMVDKFFDSEKGEFVKNEFIDMLYNEQKIKLHYKNKWYEFYIKNINENKTADKFTKSYECTDSFIEELSRTGYGITFDEELNNSVNELGDFSNEILKDSVWDYRADLNSGDFTEYREERCYKIPLSQFGGSIEAYPINLQVSKDSYNKQSNMFKDMSDEEYSFAIEKDGFNELTNIYSDKSRTIELGDDISREREIFWDPYYKDNGFGLIQGQSKKLLKGDYIYVPYSYLSFIYGSIFQDSYKATEEPARYGRKGGQDLGFALQPYSKDPTDLIQFLFFENDDEILIDEEGYIANNDHHYVMTIDDWNKTLEKTFSNISYPSDDNGLIYWKAEHSDANFSTKYEVKSSNGEDYTVNVRPDTKTIDDFCWYPVYYDGYLEQIGDKDVYGVRDISIADRTEYNLKADSYTTIYNNKAEEYKGMYSEKEMETVIENGLEPRVQSISESRIITPTLARNLIQNGEKITKVDGWEALTQNNTTEFDTGSYANLLTIAAKNTSDKDDTEDGNTDDEVINDFYLEFLSPNIMKCNDIDYEGHVSSDYALNFGLSSKEINIEKDKVYAIRICTGTWTTDNYNIYFRSNSGNEDAEEIITENEDDVNTYKATIHKYYNFLKNYSSKLNTKNTEDEFKNELKQKVLSYDQTISNKFEKFENVYIDSDINYIIYKTFKTADEKIPDDKKDTYVELQEDIYKSWQDSSYSENRSFGKKYNVDLDKIIIGTGSIDINGNYTLSGTKENSDEDSYISFADIFEEVEDKNIDFVPYIKEAKGNIKDLTKTLHHKKINDLWTWDEIESEIDIEDTPYLLFKAKANISTPYVGVRVESEPMTFNIESTSIEQYAETNKTGIKMEVYCEDNIGDKYLVNNAGIAIYKVDKTNFTEDYLNRVGWKIDESTEGTTTTTNGSFNFVNTSTAVGEGINVSQAQGDMDWVATANSGKVQYAIIRAGYGNNGGFLSDNKFITNIQNCSKNKIPYGIYIMSYASSKEEFEGEAKGLAEYLTELKNGTKDEKMTEEAKQNFQFPVFLDYEWSGGNTAGDINRNKPIKEQIELIKAFQSKIEEAGLYFGLYSNGGLLKLLYDADKEYFNSIFLWNSETQVSKRTSYTEHCEIWQYSHTGSINGISGAVDLNHFYVKPVINLHAKFFGDSSATTETKTKSTDDTQKTNNVQIKLEDLNIIDKISEFGRSNSRKELKPTGIVIHSVGAAVPDPEAWLTAWKGGKEDVDAHYVVGTDKIVQYISTDKVAWHASSYNSNYIGIEQAEPDSDIIHYTSGASFYVYTDDKEAFESFIHKVYNLTVKLAAALCLKYNINPEGNKTIVGHYEISGKGGHVDPSHLWGTSKTTYGYYKDKNSGKQEPIKTDLSMETFIRDVKNTIDGKATTTGSDPAQDKANRENPNNDYTLKTGDLLNTAKPCWTATTLNDTTNYFSNISPKFNDSCSLAYALFINGIYYGIFWLDEINGNIITEDNNKPAEDTEDPSESNKVFYIRTRGRSKESLQEIQNIEVSGVEFKFETNEPIFKEEQFDNINDIKISEDKKSVTWISTEYPTSFIDLPNGTYTLTILNVPENYLKKLNDGDEIPKGFGSDNDAYNTKPETITFEIKNSRAVEQSGFYFGIMPQYITAFIIEKDYILPPPKTENEEKEDTKEN